MLIGNEFWGYEYCTYVDAFDNTWTDAYIQQYKIQGNNFIDGNSYTLSYEARPVVDELSTEPVLNMMVKAARMAYWLGVTLDGES